MSSPQITRMFGFSPATNPPYANRDKITWTRNVRIIRWGRSAARTAPRVAHEGRVCALACVSFAGPRCDGGRRRRFLGHLHLAQQRLAPGGLTREADARQL